MYVCMAGSSRAVGAGGCAIAAGCRGGNQSRMEVEDSADGAGGHFICMYVSITIRITVYLENIHMYYIHTYVHTYNSA